VPIIIVFTRYDELVKKLEHQWLDNEEIRTKGERDSLAKSTAYEFFQRNCIMPMNMLSGDSGIPCVYVSGEGSSQLLHRCSLTPGFYYS
jgi:hypothetical protein